MAIDETLLNRINELAKKKKEEGLTPEEQDEQTELRGIYIKEFREGFKSQIENIKVIDPKGNDVTPKKIKDIKKSKKKNN